MTNLVIAAGLINIVATLVYALEIIKKNTIPQKTTWLIWFIIGVSIFFLQYNTGATTTLPFIFLQTLGVFCVFIVALFYGSKEFSHEDKIAIALVFCALILWVITDNEILSIALLIASRFVGALMTVIKTYKNPESEAIAPWLLYLLSASIALGVTIAQKDLVSLPYILYVITAHLMIFVAKYHKKYHLEPRASLRLASRSR